MKYLKTYENIFNKIKWDKNGHSFVINTKKDKPPRKFETIYPNYTDKRYWSLTYNTGKEPFVVILKFDHEEDLEPGKGGEYHFNSIVETENIDNGWKTGDKYIDFDFSRGKMYEFEEEGRLKLATPEQIELYDRYSEINKYNL